jgi:hypothetical protein
MTNMNIVYYNDLVNFLMKARQNVLVKGNII